MANKPLFIVFEGGEASGKTSISTLMSRALTSAGIPNIWTREPGGIQESEEIRELILKDRESPLSGLTEAYLFAASRAAHLEKVVKPALLEGKWVIMDRYFYSSLSYQGVGRRVGFDTVYEINEPLIHQAQPDVAFYLNPPLETRLNRLKNREGSLLNRLDRESVEFMRLVDSGYERCKEFSEFIEVDSDFSPVSITTVCFGKLLRRKLIDDVRADAVCASLNSLKEKEGVYERICEHCS